MRTRVTIVPLEKNVLQLSMGTVIVVHAKLKQVTYQTVHPPLLTFHISVIQNINLFVICKK